MRPGIRFPAAVCNANPTLRAREVCVEIVVTGRNVEVPEHFRVHVAEKVARLERYDHKIVGLEVELFHEPNRRQLKSCQRVEITGRGCGPVARAEACAQDFYAALDAAVAKLEGRLRRSHDRRKVNGKRTRVMAGRGGDRHRAPRRAPTGRHVAPRSRSPAPVATTSTCRPTSSFRAASSAARSTPPTR